ncbi:unnamed protein product [Urochloa decumbens]|uniref:Phytocyanin domain-containing protein n=1 Tax=Urochloa decumbens TaxID=240449 RepID=A0ABC9BYW9_9POAL
MASTRALLVLAVSMAAVLGMAHGASYTVGAPAASWDLRTNYTSWASGVTFRAGDQLVFKYSRAAHNVMEVSRADYDSCSGSSALNTFTTGDDVVPLTSGGVTRYFICGVPGHCDAGMKLAVRVEAAAPPSPAPVAMAPRAARPTMATPGARAPAAVAPSSSAAASAGVGSLVGLGLGAAMAGLMAM